MVLSTKTSSVVFHWRKLSHPLMQNRIGPYTIEVMKLCYTHNYYLQVLSSIVSKMGNLLGENIQPTNCRVNIKDPPKPWLNLPRQHRKKSVAPKSSISVKIQAIIPQHRDLSCFKIWQRHLAWFQTTLNYYGIIVLSPKQTPKNRAVPVPFLVKSQNLTIRATTFPIKVKNIIGCIKSLEVRPVRGQFPP